MYRKYKNKNKKNKNKKKGGNTSNTVKTNGGDGDYSEIEDWNIVDETFGEVYCNNRYWSLREIVTKNDLLEEVNQQIVLLNELISDFTNHFNKSKMSDNVSKKS